MIFQRNGSSVVDVVFKGGLGSSFGSSVVDVVVVVNRGLGSSKGSPSVSRAGPPADDSVIIAINKKLVKNIIYLLCVNQTC
jgi:hypothetical protein